MKEIEPHYPHPHPRLERSLKKGAEQSVEAWLAKRIERQERRKSMRRYMFDVRHIPAGGIIYFKLLWGRPPYTVLCEFKMVQWLLEDDGSAWRTRLAFHIKKARRTAQLTSLELREPGQ